MSDLAFIFALATLAIALVLLLRRANELFVVRVVSGCTIHTRGHVPPRLLSEIKDVLARAQVHELELRVVSEDQRPKLKLRGTLNESAQQQLRNVLGQYTLMQIRNGARPSPR